MSYTKSTGELVESKIFHVNPSSVDLEISKWGVPLAAKSLCNILYSAHSTQILHGYWKNSRIPQNYHHHLRYRTPQVVHTLDQAHRNNLAQWSDLNLSRNPPRCRRWAL